MVQHAPSAELDPTGIFAALDGQRSIADLCRLRGEPDFVVMRSIFQLVRQGLVALRPPRPDPQKMVIACNDAVALILRELDAMDQGDPVRAQLAEFAKVGAFVKLFAGAGPADDGTLDVGRVVANLARLVNSPAGEQQLATKLREYVGYALFLARPHLNRAQQGSSGSTGKRLSMRVSALLEGIGGEDKTRPTGGG
jgi:hypothetical protein